VIELYRIESDSGLAVEVITLGASIHRVLIPQSHGRALNIALGLRSLEEYVTHASHYFGATVGRYANRIRGGRFSLDGVTHLLALNDGQNSLHGGPHGLHRHVWNVLAVGDNSIRLHTSSPDGEMGYPGTLLIDVTYALADTSLTLDYRATTDAPTVINLTNHTYWNLAGEGAGSVEGHLLELNASGFTPIGPDLIPTGEISQVDRTPLDFRVPIQVGARLRDPYDQIALAGGYDHNFVIDRDGTDALAFAARALEPISGRALEIYTTEPGVQFYSGNFLDGSIVGVGGRPYRQRDGFALETQHFPDSPNHPNFPPTVLRAGGVFASTTVYRFRW
jgi:aldose 1-epimerase